MIDKIETQLENNKKLIKAIEKESKVLIAMLAEYKSWQEEETDEQSKKNC